MTLLVPVATITRTLSMPFELNFIKGRLSELNEMKSTPRLLYLIKESGVSDKEDQFG